MHKPALIVLVIVLFLYTGCSLAQADSYAEWSAPVKVAMATGEVAEPEIWVIPLVSASEPVCPAHINFRKRGFERTAAFRALEWRVQDECFWKSRNLKWARRQHARLNAEQKLVRQNNGLIMPRFAQAGG